MVLANTPSDRVSGRDSLVSGRHGVYVGWSWRGNRSSWRWSRSCRTC